MLYASKQTGITVNQNNFKTLKNKTAFACCMNVKHNRNLSTKEIPNKRVK
jgi:hypothetical protein